MTNTKRFRVILVFVLILASGGYVFSYSFDAYKGMIGERVLSIAPTETVSLIPEADGTESDS
jgi:hypothetical protein